METKRGAGGVNKKRVSKGAALVEKKERIKKESFMGGSTSGEKEKKKKGEF